MQQLWFDFLTLNKFLLFFKNCRYKVYYRYLCRENLKLKCSISVLTADKILGNQIILNSERMAYKLSPVDKWTNTSSKT